MTSIDRSLVPPVKGGVVFQPSDPAKTILRGGVPLFVIEGGAQEVCRIELLFRAGMREEANFLVPGAVSSLLLNGTSKRSAEEIARHFEFYGASVDTGCTADYAALAIVCLNKFLPEVLPLVAEVLAGASFPGEELSLYKSQSIQRLQVQNKKISFVSKKIFNRSLFGQASPYGYCQSEAGYHELTREALAQFHHKTCRQQMLGIIASGRVTTAEITLLDACFGAWRQGAGGGPPASIPNAGSPRRVYEEWDDSIQTSLRLGRMMFSRHHPDFIPMTILNCILGGYFGSRLMANIREDKGFSYGIGSGLAPLEETGYLYIATEVRKEARENAIAEIFSELKRLRDEPVPEEELKLVVNYMTGMLQRGFDGPFAVAGSYRPVMLSGMDLGYYRKYLEILHVVTPEQLHELAGKYLVDEHFLEIAVG